MLEVNKEKRELTLAPGEWAMIYNALVPVTKNGAFSIRHLEGAVLVVMECIKERKEALHIQK